MGPPGLGGPAAAVHVIVVPTGCPVCLSGVSVTVPAIADCVREDVLRMLEACSVAAGDAVAAGDVVADAVGDPVAVAVEVLEPVGVADGAGVGEGLDDADALGIGLLVAPGVTTWVTVA